MKALHTILLLCFLLPGITFANSLCPKPMKVASEPWPPYLVPTANGYIGLDANVLLAVFSEMGCEIEWVDMPWARSLVSAGNGMIDIVTGASQTSDRGKKFYFSLPYRHEKIELFVRKDAVKSYQFKGWMDLPKAKFKIGLIKSAIYPGAFQEAKKHPEFIASINHVTTDNQMIKMLVHGHLDGFVSEREPVFGLAEELGLKEKIDTYQPLGQKGKLHYLFSKRSVPKAFVTEFNRVFSLLQKQGVLKHWNED